MPVFQRRIDAKIQKAMRGPKTKKKVGRAAERLVNRAKSDFVEDIYNDPISKKIQSEPEVRGSFGFREGDMPVVKLQQSISEKIDINRTPKIRTEKKKTEYVYNIKYPTYRQIYAESVLNLPWISKTWVEELQKGLSNIERYLFLRGKGRSTFGLQMIKPVTNQKTALQDDNYLNRIRGYFADSLTKNGLKTKRQNARSI